MAPEEKRSRPWVKDVTVFAVAALASLHLTWCLAPRIPDDPFEASEPLIFKPVAAVVLECMFVAPSKVAQDFGWESLAKLLLFINPLIYGLAWWLAWRMFRLMRTKPAEGESNPLHNE